MIHICEMPIKCPVAALEFAFLADSCLTERGLREKTTIVYVTPLSGAFTKPIASGILGHLLEEKRISEVHDFNIANIDGSRHGIVSRDDKGFRTKHAQSIWFLENSGGHTSPPRRNSSSPPSLNSGALPIFIPFLLKGEDTA